MTGSIRNFEKLNFTPNSSVFCFSQGQTSKYDRLAHVTILGSVKNGHFGRKLEKNTTTLVAIALTTKIVIEKQQIAEVAETIPSCNYCVATIVARPLRTR